ncbi:MAG: biopolymer transporter ExbD [Chryseobacterium sp. SCN 40-13]|nr:MAG: biopolymer transporter ExbD [Chryseobacterium sp. SCN 40-13]
MADIQVNDNSGKGKKVRSKKQPPHVDLTPMVDLAFLLITFFMLVTTFNKPNVMDLGLPAKPKEPTNEPKNDIDLKNSISIIIGKDNRVFYHQEEQASLTDQNMLETSFDREGIRKVVQEAKAKAVKPDIFTVIIKPTDEALYKNFVDMLDEMAITKNERYGITEIRPWEQEIYDRKIGVAAAPAANSGQ